MPRNSTFTTEDFLRSATALIADKGPEGATTAAILREAKAPAGSFYYRFESRDALLGELWLSLVEQYQREFLFFLQKGDGLSAALFTPSWTRTHSLEARVLLLHSKRDFGPDKWPTNYVERAQKLSSELRTGLRKYAKTYCGGNAEAIMQKVQFALIDVPYASVRRYLSSGQSIPESVDVWVRDCFFTLQIESGAGQRALN